MKNDMDSFNEIDRINNIIYAFDKVRVYKIDGNSNKILKTLHVEPQWHTSGMSIDSELERIYVGLGVNEGDKTTQYLIIIDANELIEIDRIPISSVGSNDITIEVDNNSHHIYYAQSAQFSEGNVVPDSVAVIDGYSNEILKKIPVGIGPNKIFINNIDEKIYVFNQSPNSITVIDRDSHNVINNYSLNLGGAEVIDEYNNKLYSNKGNIVSLEDFGVIGYIDLVYQGGIYSLFVNRSRGELYSGSNSGELAVYDLDSGEYLRPIKFGIKAESIFVLPGINTLVGKTSESIFAVNLQDNNIVFSNKIVGREKLYIAQDKLYIQNNDFSIEEVDNKLSLSLLLSDIDSISNKIFINESSNRIYISDGTKIFVYDKSTLKHIKNIDLQCTLINIDTQEQKLYGFENKSLIVIDEITDEILYKEFEVEEIEDIIVDTVNNKIYLRPNNNGLLVLDVDTLEIIKTIDFQSGWGYKTSMCIDEVHSKLYTYHLAGNNTIVEHIIIDTKTDEVLYSYTTRRMREDSSVSFDYVSGKFYALNDYVNFIYVFEDSDFIGYPLPPSPTSLTTTSDDVITTSWPPVDNPDVQGYNIYRSPAGADQWTKLNTELVTYTSFLDETAVPNTPYDYHVSTTGQYNISSDPSESVTATLIIDPGFSLSSILASKSTEQDTSIDYIITSESIEQFASLIDLSVDGLPEGIAATLSSNQLRPGDVTSLTLEIPTDIESGTYSFDMVGVAEEIEHQVPLSLTVVETELEKSVITLDLNSASIEYGEAVFASGRIFPPVSTEVSVSFTGASGTDVISTTSLSNGTYSTEFEPDTPGDWTAKASWPGDSKYAGAQSEEKSFEALSGRTKITCTTDAPADAEIGWQMTIKGKVFPNPEVGSVTMYVKKPDGIEETIDGLLINELGYYGYNITAD